MDVLDRLDKEKKLSDSLWKTWIGWSDKPDPKELKPDVLRDYLQRNSYSTVFSQWDQGYRSVQQQFKVKHEPRRAAMAFLLFFDDWVDDIVGGWQHRIDKYQAKQQLSEDVPPWEFVRGEGRNVSRVRREDAPAEPVPKNRFQNPFATRDGDQIRTKYGNYEWVERPVLYDPRDPRKVIGAKPIVYPSDADRIAVGGITASNTYGELFGAREVMRQGGPRIESLWRTDIDPCERCEDLAGKPRRVWSRVAKKGPPLHEHCRCYLEHRLVLWSQMGLSQSSGVAPI